MFQYFHIPPFLYFFPDPSSLAFLSFFSPRKGQHKHCGQDRSLGIVSSAIFVISGHCLWDRQRSAAAWRNILWKIVQLFRNLLVKGFLFPYPVLPYHSLSFKLSPHLSLIVQIYDIFAAVLRTSGKSLLFVFLFLA